VRELANRIFQRDRLDMALTHPSEWGVRPLQQDVPGQVIWVWIELAFGFIYNIEALGRTLGTDWRADAPQDDWKIVHFLGYDNTFYHSILSPALYKLASPEWTPDVDYHVNEFYLLDGDKFSTSRRHVIWGKDILSPATVDGIRYYLALTRPETKRTNFTMAAYQRAVTDRLVGTWQRWLNDLGTRIEAAYDGAAPDAGVWTPEHTAFLARLGARLAEMAGCLGQDGFSLNHAARTLDGIVDDTLRFAAFEARTAGVGEWKDETRTAIALELAAARLLACCAAPVMPRFAARLAGALGVPPPDRWPKFVALVPPGSTISLAGQVFFALPPDAGAAPAGTESAASEPASGESASAEPASAEPAASESASAEPAASEPASTESASTESATSEPATSESASPGSAGSQDGLLGLLSGLVRQTLRLPGDLPVADATLVALGAESMQAIALQYQIAQRTGADIAVEYLLGDRTVAELAGLLGASAGAAHEPQAEVTL